MYNFMFTLVAPPVAGLVIAYSGKKLLGDTIITYIASLAIAAAVGVAFVLAPQ